MVVRAMTGFMLCFMTLGLADYAAASDRPIVAVFDVEVKGLKMDPKVLDRLTDYLGALMAERGYKVVPRSQLRERLRQEKKGSYRRCYDQVCQIDIGKEMAAQKSLATQVLKIGSKCKVTVTLFDLLQSASEGAGTTSGGCNEDGVVESLEKDVANLLGGGPQAAPVRPELGVEPPEPKSSDLTKGAAGPKNTSIKQDKNVRPPKETVIKNFIAGKYPKVYVGPNSEGVIIVPLVTEKNEPKQALIKFFGVEHDWDGKVFLHTVRETDTKIDYVMQWEGQDYVSVAARSYYGGEKNYFCAMPGMRNDITLRYSEEKSKEIIGQHIVTEYEQQTESGKK
jgi:hypothetical protein